jgi:hypothetical protein
MIRIGIVAEGKSEWLVLEAVMRVLHDEIDFVRIRPDLDMLSGQPFGWRGVKAWCSENGNTLGAFMKGVRSKPLDLMVIHCDCSMAHNVSANRPCPPARDTADALRDVIVREWLRLDTIPVFVVLTTPSRTMDAWVVSVLDPPHEEATCIECLEAVENVLVARHLLRKKDGEVKKQEARYRPLAERVAAELPTARARCTEAERFVVEFQAALAACAPP